MLGHSLDIPTLARVRPPRSGFPAMAFAFWEGQGQSNMTGYNQIGDAPASLRVMNPHVEMLDAAGAWRPYGLLATGESQTFEGTLYEGKYDEAETPAAAGGAGPLVGLHEAILGGAMQGPAGLLAAGVLTAKFSDAGKPLDAFLPDYDDGTPPLGGVNYAARNDLLPAALRARLAAGDAIYHQGKIWLQGETDAATARAAEDLGHPALVNYAARLDGLRAFERAQLGAPRLPWYMVTIAEPDEYAAAINDELATLCRWRVTLGGDVVDLGEGRDETSYLIDHMILPVGDVHFNMTQMRAIGALIWEAHLHHAGAQGATTAHPIHAVRPVWQKPPLSVATAADSVTIEAVANENGTLRALALPAGSAAPGLADIVLQGTSAAGLKGRVATLAVGGLEPETDYDLWTVYVATTGEATPAVPVAATTAALPASAGWTPAEAGALFWWDAQDAATVTEASGAVASWAAKAGGVTLTPSAAAQRPVLNPTGLNALPALDFNGDDDLEGTGAALSADMLLLVVAEIDAVTNGSEALFHLKDKNLAIRAQHNAEFRARFELMNGVNTNLSPPSGLDYSGAPHLFLGRYDSAADLMEIWIDGSLAASQSTYSIDLAGTDQVRVMRAWGTALRLDGKVGEIVAVASSAVADRERLEGYAAHRWGLAGLLPAGHPWKTEAP